MKKILLFIFLVVVMTGCSLGKDMYNTPTKQVEMFLSRYQSLDQEVLKDLDKVIAEEELFNGAQREEYRKLFKKHYQNLKYDIKEENIDGDKAFVKTEIEVTDYSKILAAADQYKAEHPEEFKDENGMDDNVKFMDYRLARLKEAKDTVTYTIDFNLTKVDKKWKLDDLSSTDEDKIHGIYVY